MAKQKVHTVGEEIETTVVFTPKTTLEELAKAKNTQKRTRSMSGTLGKKIGEGVEQKHLARMAFGMACRLKGLDDERLHIELPSLLKYCADLGLFDRVREQEKEFLAGTSSEPAGKFTNGEDRADEGNVTQIGRGPRKVAEKAGDGFEPTH